VVIDVTSDFPSPGEPESLCSTFFPSVFRRGHLSESPYDCISLSSYSFGVVRFVPGSPKLIFDRLVFLFLPPLLNLPFFPLMALAGPTLFV